MALSDFPFQAQESIQKRRKDSKSQTDDFKEIAFVRDNKTDDHLNSQKLTAHKTCTQNPPQNPGPDREVGTSPILSKELFATDPCLERKIIFFNE